MVFLVLNVKCVDWADTTLVRMLFFSTPPHFDTMTTFHIHPSTWLHRLPDNVSFEEGALCEPLAIAMAAIDRSGLKLADPIMIAGAGPIGLVTL